MAEYDKISSLMRESKTHNKETKRKQERKKEKVKLC
jgi:hypothetical protein